MTIEKAPGNFVFIMKNMNRMETDKAIVEKMTQSKVGYCIRGEYLLVKTGQANKAILELKKWHLL